jgi:hypothetical protein
MASMPKSDEAIKVMLQQDGVKHRAVQDALGHLYAKGKTAEEAWSMLTKDFKDEMKKGSDMREILQRFLAKITEKYCDPKLPDNQ